jgi:hypothetical protein
MVKPVQRIQLAAAVAIAPMSAMTGQLIGDADDFPLAGRALFFRREVPRGETSATLRREERSEGMSLLMFAHPTAKGGRDTPAQVKSSEIVGIREIRGRPASH